MAEPERSKVTVYYGACGFYWITKATDTYLEYLIFNAITLQQWVPASASVLHLYVHFTSCQLLIFNTYRTDIRRLRFYLPQTFYMFNEGRLVSMAHINSWSKSKLQNRCQLSFVL